MIESAVLTYRDGGEVKTAESDTVAENFAVFLLPIAQDGVERVWESAVVTITGIEYTVSLQDSEGMTQQKFQKKLLRKYCRIQKKSLDEETANLVEDSVISTKGDGITGEEIADSIEKSIETRSGCRRSCPNQHIFHGVCGKSSTEVCDCVRPRTWWNRFWR